MPKWSFTAKRARIKLNDRAVLSHPVLRVKNVPILYLPYVSLSISPRDRSSGFLLPTSGSSNIKGRTLHTAYYQTLAGAPTCWCAAMSTPSAASASASISGRARMKTRISPSALFWSSTACLARSATRKAISCRIRAEQFLRRRRAVFQKRICRGRRCQYHIEFRFPPGLRRKRSSGDLARRAVTTLSQPQLRSLSFNLSLNEQSTFIGNEIIKTRELPSFELAQRSTQISESFRSISPSTLRSKACAAATPSATPRSENAVPGAAPGFGAALHLPAALLRRLHADAEHQPALDFLQRQLRPGDTTSNWPKPPPSLRRVRLGFPPAGLGAHLPSPR